MMASKICIIPPNNLEMDLAKSLRPVESPGKPVSPGDAQDSPFPQMPRNLSLPGGFKLGGPPTHEYCDVITTTGRASRRI
jgi:hypothetical protein